MGDQMKMDLLPLRGATPFITALSIKKHGVSIPRQWLDISHLRCHDGWYSDGLIGFKGEHPEAKEYPSLSEIRNQLLTSRKRRPIVRMKLFTWVESHRVIGCVQVQAEDNEIAYVDAMYYYKLAKAGATRFDLTELPLPRMVGGGIDAILGINKEGDAIGFQATMSKRVVEDNHPEVLK